MTTRHKKVGVTVLLGLLAFAPLASSVDSYQTYPGILCRSATSTGYTQNFGMVANQSTTAALSVHCPLSNTIDPTDLRSSTFAGARVAVFDHSTASNIPCTTTSETVSGSLVYRDYETRSTSGTSANVYNLSFGALDLQAYNYVTCTIPPAQSGVTSQLAYIRVTMQ